MFFSVINPFSCSPFWTPQGYFTWRHCSDPLRNFQQLPIVDRIRFRLLSLSNKPFQKLTPFYLLSLFFLYLIGSSKLEMFLFTLSYNPTLFVLKFCLFLSSGLSFLWFHLCCFLILILRVQLKLYLPCAASSNNLEANLSSYL